MSAADEITKLSELRDKGLLTNDEFEQQKQKVLIGTSATTVIQEPPITASEWSSISLINRWWFQALLTFLIIPVGVIIMLACTTYKRDGDKAVRIGKGFKLLFIVIALLCWLLALAHADTNKAEHSAAATDAVPMSVAAEAEPAGTARPLLPACDSAFVRAKVQQAVTEKLAILGMPTSVLGDAVDHMTVATSAHAQALKRAAHQGPVVDVEVCSVPDPQIPDFLVTIVARRTDGEVVGLIANFGIPGQLATFGKPLSQ